MTAAVPTLVVGGPTATGKTLLGVELALRLGGEMLNADSRQAARRLYAGTATPTAADLRGVRCHLLDETEPGRALSVADWLAKARDVLDDLDRREVPAVVVGGTGQYVRALREGWEVAGRPPDAAQRAALNAEAASPGGLERLVTEVRARDVEGARHIDLANPRRVIRAVERLRDGVPSLAASGRRDAGRPLSLVVLDAERPLHRQAISERVAWMFEAGDITGEVRDELAAGTSPEALRRAGIGYAEAMDLLDGHIDVPAAREATVRRTLRYAKAQRTWFRAEPAVLRLERGASTLTAEIAGLVLDAVRQPRRSPLRGT